MRYKNNINMTKLQKRKKNEKKNKQIASYLKQPIFVVRTSAIILKHQT
jgi:hypothetical protein